ncbi:hypothetical protein E2C01_055535 [Portunus trituberculatus]|uniref:Uncharacterized protein n=1 Tax=Portunus trituberculatus TaxID=210409 RepID=A0A5B7GV11_PORTR|nr:hypothetical protein [Portunus trituberculatus]
MLENVRGPNSINKHKLTRVTGGLILPGGLMPCGPLRDASWNGRITAQEKPGRPCRPPDGLSLVIVAQGDKWVRGSRNTCPIMHQWTEIPQRSKLPGPPHPGLTMYSAPHL